MTTTTSELTSELLGLINGLKDSFYDFNFKTKKGLTRDDLDGVAGFEKFVIVDGSATPIDFSQFKKLIAPSLYSKDDDFNVDDFEWEEVENNFDYAIDSYNNYKLSIDQINENLTGQQTLDSVVLYDETELKNLLLQNALDHNLVYEINVAGEIHYIPSQKLQDDL